VPQAVRMMGAAQAKRTLALMNRAAHQNGNSAEALLKGRRGLYQKYWKSFLDAALAPSLVVKPLVP
jgi:hypothetical protein